MNVNATVVVDLDVAHEIGFGPGFVPHLTSAVGPGSGEDDNVNDHGGVQVHVHVNVKVDD